MAVSQNIEIQSSNVQLVVQYFNTDAAAFDVLVGHGHHISQIHYEGDSTETVRTDTSGTVVGVDYSES